MKPIRILFIGDVVGEPGRRILRERLPELKQKEAIDFVIANGENCAGGSGITEKTATELFDSGVNVITSGDHVFKQREVYALLAKSQKVLRPANYPEPTHGVGASVYTIHDEISIGVINIIGRVFLSTVECPFQKAKALAESLAQETPIIIVDIHAEATSEKVAMGWYLDGIVSAVVGTHTHIQTADETILPNGTAYITDVGMTGPFRSVLGREVDDVISRFLTQIPSRMRVAKEDIRINGLMVDIDFKTGKACALRRVCEKF